MFFLTPRHVKQGRQFVKDARKVLAYKRDLWSAATIAEVEQHIAKLEDTVPSRDKAQIADAAHQLDTLLGKHLPAPTDAALRENVEVFLVAIAVALGVRTYFLQPFTIPTGSMQPTLNGIIGFPTTEPPPNILVRVFDRALFGKSWIDVVAEEDEAIMRVEERSKISVTRRGWGYLTHCAIITDKHEYVIDAAKETVERYFLMADQAARRGVYKKGEVIARGHIDSGDMVFVDKFSFHFRKPPRDAVFVFNTQGIPTRENQNQHMVGPSQYYIKRLAGTPGDTLQIKPPELFVNGQRAVGRGYERVMSGTLEKPNDGYQGYSNASLQGGFGSPTFLYPMHYLDKPEATVTLDHTQYYALGDNSYHSSDSRD